MPVNVCLCVCNIIAVKLHFTVTINHQITNKIFVLFSFVCMFYNINITNIWVSRTNHSVGWSSIIAGSTSVCLCVWNMILVKLHFIVTMKHRITNKIFVFFIFLYMFYKFDITNIWISGSKHSVRWSFVIAVSICVRIRK